MVKKHTAANISSGYLNPTDRNIFNHSVLKNLCKMNFVAQATTYVALRIKEKHVHKLSV